MIKNFFKIQIKYISHEQVSHSPEYDPDQKLTEKLTQYKKLLGLQKQNDAPVSPDLLTDLGLAQYIPLLPKYRTNSRVKERLDYIIQDTFLELPFKRMKTKNDISHLLGKYPELKLTRGSDIIDNQASDTLKAAVIETKSQPKIQNEKSRFLLLINYFLDMIKNKPTDSK